MRRWTCLKTISIFLILIMALLLIAIPVLKYRIPFSWDVWFHIRMGESFTHGFVWWDWGSFGPTGRPNLYPPAFHILLALISKIGGWSTQSVARYLPMLLYPLTAFLIYWFSKLLFDRKVGIFSSIMYIFIPVAVDRGVISSPQALAIILMLLSMIFLIKSEEDWRFSVLAGVFGAGVVLSHGLTLIMFSIMLILYGSFTYFLVYKHDKAEQWRMLRNILVVVGLSAILPSYWLYYLFDHGVYSRIPESVAMSIKDYPVKLGVFQLALSFVGAGIAYVNRKRSDIFMMSLYIIAFILTTSLFWVLPSRYIEFLAIPVAILAALGLRHLLSSSKEVIAIGIVGIFLVTMSAPLDYVDSISPLVYENEEQSFLWLRDYAVVDGQIMTGWFFAPISAAISGKIPIKGSYYSGSFRYSERTNDTNDFYHGDMSILDKYDVRVVYVGRKERYDYEEVALLDGRDSFNKLYSCEENAFYSVAVERLN